MEVVIGCQYAFIDDTVMSSIYPMPLFQLVSIPDFRIRVYDPGIVEFVSFKGDIGSKPGVARQGSQRGIPMPLGL